MKKEDVNKNLKAIQAKIKEIETRQNDEVVLYATKDKYLDGIGYICEINSFGGLVNAQTAINNLTHTDVSEAVKMLELTDEETPENEVRILGFLAKHWNADIKSRLGELRTEIQLTKLRDAEVKLLKHSDSFELDTDGIEDLLA